VRRGRALWESITGAFDLEPHERSVLAQVVKVADRVAALDAVVDDQGVLSDDPKRGTVAHPALVESRQQRLTLARMLTALRLPDADQRRPQRRGMRGVYRLGRDGAA
jgi:hypothetical protein